MSNDQALTLTNFMCTVPDHYTFHGNHKRWNSNDAIVTAGTQPLWEFDRCLQVGLKV